MTAVIGLILILVLSYIAAALIIKSRVETTAEHTAKRGYLAYASLPTLLFFSLIYITCNLGRHCDQEEYASYCRYQQPALLLDCDVHEEHIVVIENPASYTEASSFTTDDKEGLTESYEDIGSTIVSMPGEHIPLNADIPCSTYYGIYSTDDSV